MTPMIKKLNRQADKLNRPHCGEPGNQWRNLEYSELGVIDRDELERIARLYEEPIQIAKEAPPYTVYFPSSRNYRKRAARAQ
jgi:hypothetical protein